MESSTGEVSQFTAQAWGSNADLHIETKCNHLLDVETVARQQSKHIEEMPKSTTFVTLFVRKPKGRPSE